MSATACVLLAVTLLALFQGACLAAVPAINFCTIVWHTRLALTLFCILIARTASPTGSHCHPYSESGPLPQPLTAMSNSCRHLLTSMSLLMQAVSKCLRELDMAVSSWGSGPGLL